MPYDTVITSEFRVDTTKARQDISNFARSIDLGRGFSLGKITGQVSEFQKSLEASNARVLAFTASAGQLYTYVRAFDAILRSTIEVQKSLANLNAIFGLSSRQLDSFTTSLFKVANETGQSFKVASDAALQFTRQGLGMEETLKRTRDALTLTRLSGLDVAESIRALTTAINGFNQAGLDSTTILNKMTTVDSTFAISAGDIAQALTRVGSIAKDTGVSFDKLLGLITAARVTTGREGSVIATALGTIFQRIERPQVLDQLKQLKVDVEDVNGETLSADKILQNLADTYDTLTAAQKASVVQFAGGVRQGNVLRALMADLAKDNSIYTRATEASANATDVAAKRQSELNKTLSSRINETVNNLTQSAFRGGTITLTPVINRLLSAGNFLTGNFNSELSKQGQSIGDNLGKGVLLGIGNFLAGPGLGLAGTIVAKLFLNFASFASKSLSTLVEIGSKRYQVENAISNLLQKQPELFSELNKLGTDNVAIQQRITQELEKQIALQNAKASITNTIVSNTGNAFFGNKNFRITKTGELAPNEAAGFIPSLTEKFAAHQAGYKPGDIKEMHVAGVGKVTYNSAESIKHFSGMGQPAILPPQNTKAGANYKGTFQSIHGFNPYSAGGIIPAASGLVSQGGLFSGTIGVSNQGILSAKTVNELNDEIEKFKNQIRFGQRNQTDINQALRDLTQEYRLTEQAQRKIRESYEATLKPVLNRKVPFGNSLSGLSTTSANGQLDFGLTSPSLLDESGRNLNQGEFLPIVRQALVQTSLRQKARQAQAGAFYDPRILTSVRTQLTSQAINELNLGSLLFGGFGGNFSYVKGQSKELGLESSFRNKVSDLQNKAFLASFIAPLIGGTLEQFGSGSTSTTGRGFARLAGGGANIASFALGGAGVGGPVGAAVGGGIGLLTELPSIIKAFTDTLPDLERGLDEVKESSNKTITSLNTYAQTTEQLQDIYNNISSATKGQVKSLESQQAIAFSQLPPNVKSELLKNKGDTAAQAEVLGNASTVAKQQVEAYQNLIELKNKVDKSDEGTILKGLSATYSFQNIFSHGLLGPTIGGAQDITRQNQQIANLQLELETKKFLGNSLGFQNLQGHTLLQDLTPQDISKIQGAQGLQKVNALQGVFTQHGIIGDDVNKFFESLKSVFSGAKGNSLQVLDTSLDKIFSNKGIANIKENGKIVGDAIEKTNLSFVNFSKTLTGLQDKLNKFTSNVQSSGIIRESLLSGNLKAGEITQETSNRLALLKSGNNPFLASQFQFQEERTKIQNERTIGFQKNNDDIKNKVAEIFSQIANSSYEKIRQDIEGKKSNNKTGAQGIDDLNQQLKILDKLFNTPESIRLKESLQKPQNLTETNITKVQDFLKNQLNLFDLLKQTPDKNPKIDDLAKQFNVKPDQLRDILGQGSDVIDAYSKGLEDLNKALDDFRKSNLKVQGTSFEANKVNQARYKQNLALSPIDTALSSDQQRIFQESQLNTIRQGGQPNLGKSLGAGFQYNNAQFLTDAQREAQDFGKQFVSTISSAFAEIETSSKKFTDILRDNFLKLAQEVTQRFVSQGLNTLLGGTVGKLAGNLLSTNGYSNGGFVGMGSGTKDDVPAMLTGGEYVLNKRATNAIGIGNLNKINGYADGDLVVYQQPNQYSFNYSKKPNNYAGATLADSITSTGTSASINLANTLLAANGKSGGRQFDVSNLLSTFGATDSNNPQNKLKFAREKFILSRNIANRRIGQERSQINTNQDISLGAAFVSAATQAYSGLNTTGTPNGAQNTDFNLGQGPVSAGYASNSSNSFFNQFDQTDTTYLNNLSGFGQAKGGLFGGDTRSDTAPAMLMGGEYVVKPSVVSRYGANYFNSLNRRYAAGGYVGGSSSDGGYSDMSSQMEQSVQILQEISNKLGSNNLQSNNRNLNNTNNVSGGNGNSPTNNGLTNHVTVNITMSPNNQSGGSPTTNGNTNTTSTSTNQNDKDTAKKLGDLVQSQMIQTLTNASKQGGLLWERFQTRR